MKNNFDYKIAHLEDILTNDNYKQALKNLKYEEKEILYYLAVEEYSIRELSLKLSLSQRRIRRIKKNAIEHFKTNLDKICKSSKNVKSISKDDGLKKTHSKKLISSKKGGDENE